MKIWKILTPGGYLYARFQGSKRKANDWAKIHLSVFKIEEDKEFRWRKPDCTPTLPLK